MVYLPTCTIRFKSSCRFKYTMHGSYGEWIKSPPKKRHHQIPCLVLRSPCITMIRHLRHRRLSSGKNGQLQGWGVWSIIFSPWHGPIFRGKSGETSQKKRDWERVKDFPKEKVSMQIDFFACTWKIYSKIGGFNPSVKGSTQVLEVWQWSLCFSICEYSVSKESDPARWNLLCQWIFYVFLWC